MHMPSATAWAAKGITFLFQVITPLGVKNFQSLKEEFELPPHMLFSYMQLRHALNAQFTDGFPNTQMLPMVEVIIGEEPAKLISSLYSILRTRSVARIIDKAKVRWEEDIGPIDDSDWEEIIENVKKTSSRLSERLTQLYVIHKSYLTPSRLVKFSPDQNPNCPRCSVSPCSFFHLIWECLDIQNYWTQIIKFLHDHMGSPLQLDPKMCLLGILPDVNMEKFLATFLYETLFCARKVIARHWMRANSPTIQAWIDEINKTLPYKRVLYSHRGCPAKYNKIWDRWLNSSETCVELLIEYGNT